MSEVAMPFPLFDGTEINWDRFFDNSYELPPTSTPINQSIFPPSPVPSVEHSSPVDPKIRLAEVVRQSGTGEFALPYDRFLTSSIEVENVNRTTTTTSNVTAMTSSYPSPSLSASPSITTQIEYPYQSRDASPKPLKDSITVCRRPGRPRKAQNDKRPTGQNLVIMKRHIHNDSSMRSRARFNTVLEELWNEIPEAERLPTLSEVTDPRRPRCRTEKIEVVISYIGKLHKCMRN